MFVLFMPQVQARWQSEAILIHRRHRWSIGSSQASQAIPAGNQSTRVTRSK